MVPIVSISDNCLSSSDIVVTAGEPQLAFFQFSHLQENWRQSRIPNRCC